MKQVLITFEDSITLLYFDGVFTSLLYCDTVFGSGWGEHTAEGVICLGPVRKNRYEWKDHDIDAHHLRRVHDTFTVRWCVYEIPTYHNTASVSEWGANTLLRVLSARDLRQECGGKVAFCSDESQSAAEKIGIFGVVALR